MSNTNTSAFSLPVKIIQLVVNIIFGSVYKMLETLLVVILVGLIGLFGSLAYLLGKIHGLKAGWEPFHHIPQNFLGSTL